MTVPDNTSRSEPPRYPSFDTIDVEITCPHVARAYFVSWLSGYLRINATDWQPDTTTSDGESLVTIRRELRALLEAHLPHLLKPHEGEDDDDRQL